MTRRSFLTLTSFLLFGSLLITRAAEGIPNTLTEAEKAGGWRLLFNGKDFDGWNSYSGSIPSTSWIVADGCIKSIKRNGRPGGADLLTDQKFTDFEFSFEWKIAQGGNSGIKYFCDRSQK